MALQCLVPTAHPARRYPPRLVDDDPRSTIEHANLHRTRGAFMACLLSLILACQTATALGKLGHPDGELNLTRAAAKHGVIQMVRISDIV